MKNLSIRRRVTMALAGSAIAAVTLSACAGSPNPAETASGTATEITIYSPQGDGDRGAFIAEQAKEELGLEIKFASGGGGDLTERLIGEKNNPQADIVLGLGEPLLYQLDAEGLFAPSTPSWGADIPSQFKLDTDSFTLFSQTPIVMAYNADAISEGEAPASWTDLADEKWKGKFVFPNVGSQTGQAAVVGILWRYADEETGEISDEGWETLTAILNNAVSVPDGQAFDWTLVADGSQPIVINWLGGIQTGAADNDLNLQPIDAEGGSPFVSTGTGIVSGTDAGETAAEFIDWFGSADFQAAFVEATGNDTPILPAALEQLPDASAALEDIAKQDIDWSVASTQLTDWLERIQLEILG